MEEPSRYQVVMFSLLLLLCGASFGLFALAFFYAGKRMLKHKKRPTDQILSYGWFVGFAGAGLLGFYFVVWAIVNFAI